MTFKPGSVYDTLTIFASAFTTPTFKNFVSIATGWLLCRDKHTISQTLRVGLSMGFSKDFSTLYRFFSRARWVPDELGRLLFYQLLRFIPGQTLFVLTDDTLCKRSGPHVWGGGMHHDALASNYGRNTSKGRHVAFAFGVNWVILALWAPLPWLPDCGVAIPILLRLYRSKRYCPKKDYRKKTELAFSMLQVLREWTLGTGRTVMLIGDTEYACKTIVKPLPDGVDFTGPVLMNAALFEFPEPRREGQRGATKKKGDQLPSPKKMAADDAIPWQKINVFIYGRDVTILVKTVRCLWYRVSGTRPVRVVVTRDPTGRIEDRAYFSTGEGASVEDVITWFARRWSLEVTFFNAKQFLGLDEPQNGWGRRKRKPRGKKKPGPQARGSKGRKAAERTVPVIMYLVGLVYLWYFQHGNPNRDVAIARSLAPWYTQKKMPSFADILMALRLELMQAEGLSAHPVDNWVMQQFEEGSWESMVAGTGAVESPPKMAKL